MGNQSYSHQDTITQEYKYASKTCFKTALHRILNDLEEYSD